MSTPAPAADSLAVMYRRLVAFRWWLLAAEGAALVLAPGLLDIALPRPPMLAVLALQVGFNVVLRHRSRHADGITPATLFGQLSVDVVALGVLLFFSGGAANPLVSLLLPPVAVAALALPVSYVAAVAALAVGTYSLLMVLYVPLPLADASRATSLHLLGMWVTFVLSAAMLAWLIVRITATLRERDAALAAAREQALRDERVVALGALAAGAAHELGTPLATMAVIAGELERDDSLGADARADIAVLRQQVAACKAIITGLAQRAGAGRLEGAQAAAADRWLEGLRQRWHSLRPVAESRLEIAGDAPAPTFVADLALEQALLNLFNNAADAGGPVTIRAGWDADWLTVDVEDSGPGFSDDVLRGAGQAPFPARAGGAGGAGIGLFLTSAAVGRFGGRLQLANRPEGGGRARVELPLARIGGTAS